MKDGPDIVAVAALIGDHARADMLTALMCGRALTATELADAAGITRQTASAHLARLVDARLLEVEAQGRHRYFRLAGEEVAHLLESLMGVAFGTGAVRLRGSPRDPALRKARVCYDHLAGELGVLAYDGLRARRALCLGPEGLALTPAGEAFFADRFGIAAASLRGGKRPACRACLDWSERRHHLAGALGAAMLDRIVALGWARRDPQSRVMQFTPAGERSLRAAFAGADD